MSLGYLLSLDEEILCCPGSRFRDVETPRLPYLEQARPVDPNPVRVALEREPTGLTRSSSAMGMVDQVALWLMALISVVLSACLAFEAAHMSGVRRDAILSRDLRRTELELSAVNQTCRVLRAELASRIAREAQSADVWVVVAPAPARRMSAHH